MLTKDIPPSSLDALDGFSHVWVVFVFHENTVRAGNRGLSSFQAKITPPRLGRRVGVFSTRSPHRPNPIGLSVCQILRVDEKSRTLTLGGVDLVDGTPILDIKPYVPYDSVRDCIVPAWVAPPVTDDFTSSSLKVVFSLEAQAQLARIFESPSDDCKNSSFLRHYRGRQLAFVNCLEQIISQDPRSLVGKARSGEPFHMVIDGVKITIVNVAECELSVCHLEKCALDLDVNADTANAPSD